MRGSPMVAAVGSHTQWQGPQAFMALKRWQTSGQHPEANAMNKGALHKVLAWVLAQQAAVF